MNPDLNEKDFIQERSSKDPFPFWLWIAIPTIIAALLWGGRASYLEWRNTQVTSSPFLQVTNREFSNFLWQNPEYMRANISTGKVGYLPAFEYSGGTELDPTLADQYIVAPPEIVFRYHVWNRLIADDFSSRPISVSEFQEFLHAVPAWQPQYWPQATREYEKFVLDFSSHKSDEDLAALPLNTLPQDVRRAFQGWKNFYKEGDEIERIAPSYAEMSAFLEKFPHYARPYWRNIVDNYLKSVTVEPTEGVVPSNELAPFLKVAFFNFEKAKAAIQ